MSLNTVESLKKMAVGSEQSIKSYIEKAEIGEDTKKSIDHSFVVLEDLQKQIRDSGKNIKDYSDLLASLKNKNSQIEYIGLINSTGEMVSASEAIDKSNANYGHRPYYQQAIEGKTFRSEPYISNVSREYCMAISMPLKKSSREIIGVLMADVNIES